MPKCRVEKKAKARALKCNILLQRNLLVHDPASLKARMASPKVIGFGPAHSFSLWPVYNANSARSLVKILHPFSILHRSGSASMLTNKGLTSSLF